MSLQDDPDIPDAPPDDRGGEAAIDDQPLGVPAEGEDEVADQPGIPEKEPPTGG
jgi:hypothetical protein